MPSPVVAATAINRTTTTNTTSHAITLPSGIVAGNLLLVVFSVDGNPTVTIDTGVSGNDWTILGQASNGSIVTGAIAWKVAQGSDVLTLTTSASEQSSHSSYRITGAGRISGTVEGTSANGSSTNSDPPNEAHSAGARDYLYIATRSGDSTTVATVAPSGYSNLLTQAAAGTNGASTNSAEKGTTASSSDDPGTFTSASEQWVSWTLAISPAILIAASGSFSITGTAATPRAGRRVAAESGSFVVSGTAATLRIGRRVVADAGAVAVTGTDATLRASRRIAADGGSYTITGTDADLVVGGGGYTLTADPGSFSITGTDAALRVGRRVVANTGAFVITGTAASLRVTRRLSAESGSFAITGTAADLLVGRKLPAASGAFVVAGTDAAITKASRLQADAGAYTVNGTNAALRIGRRIEAGPGTYTITGTAADLIYSGGSYTLVADSGSFLISGSDATLIHTVRRPTGPTSAWMVASVTAADVASDGLTTAGMGDSVTTAEMTAIL